MRYRARCRRVGKWLSTAIAMFILAAWAVSGWWMVSWSGRPSYNAISIACYSGRLEIQRELSDLLFTWPISPSSPERLQCVPVASTGIPAPSWSWWFDNGRSAIVTVGSSMYVSIPLWLPFLLAAAPAAWLWRIDRR
ncbi:MAG: hypothetical protein ACKVW3_11795, partial [Phycisphaerales bacterium]